MPKDDFMQLYLATLFGNIGVVTIMIECGIRCPEALHCAVRQNNKKLIKLYLKKFPEQLNSVHLLDRKTPLYYACLHGNCVLVEKFLKVGARVNVAGEYHTALYVAVMHKHYSVVKTLVENDAHLNDYEIQEVYKITMDNLTMDELLETQKEMEDYNFLAKVMVDLFCGFNADEVNKNL